MTYEFELENVQLARAQQAFEYFALHADVDVLGPFHEKVIWYGIVGELRYDEDKKKLKVKIIEKPAHISVSLIKEKVLEALEKETE